MLHFVEFEKFYGNFPALTIPHLTINPGIYWIKGVNDSGKNMLLIAITGMRHLDELMWKPEHR